MGIITDTVMGGTIPETQQATDNLNQQTETTQPSMSLGTTTTSEKEQEPVTEPIKEQEPALEPKFEPKSTQDEELARIEYYNAIDKQSKLQDDLNKYNEYLNDWQNTWKKNTPNSEKIINEITNKIQEIKNEIGNNTQAIKDYEKYIKQLEHYEQNRPKEDWENIDTRSDEQKREDTAYQRAVEDMKKAGLNPASLNAGVSGGGASASPAKSKKEQEEEERKKRKREREERERIAQEKKNKILSAIFNPLGTLANTSISRTIPNRSSVNVKNNKTYTHF